ncbi:uncharacterized protein LOC131033795 [Cryptomeria japonica]|uniref:uncharacterized protein LOC131033795 n=1 Tax=Cryptomeria japonica TaxID=3369 RepID=UPI0027DA2110|nr:uncharacterized protein LOC131033795 [Cryptomeria japonica]
MDNILVTRWKNPSNPPNSADWRNAEHWKLPSEFKLFNNTKKINSKRTKWEAPSPSWHKLNFDGATHNNRQVGGRVTRDHQGGLIVAFAGSLRNHIVNQAEGMALLWRMKFVIAIGIRQLEIKGDSKIIVEAVNGRTAASWKVEAILRDARMLLANLDNFTICHIYREGNAVAINMLQEGLRCWRSTDILPVIIKGISEKEKTKF